MFGASMERKQIRTILIRLDAEEASLVSGINYVHTALPGQVSYVTLNLKTVALFDDEVEAVHELFKIRCRHSIFQQSNLKVRIDLRDSPADDFRLWLSQFINAGIQTIQI
jgi:hypothetical protein